MKKYSTGARKVICESCGESEIIRNYIAAWICDSCGHKNIVPDHEQTNTLFKKKTSSQEEYDWSKYPPEKK